MSLNDFLLKSPDMVCGLVQTLLAGRIHPIVFKADIAEFFLRVRMAVEDIDCFRFFFWSGRERTIVEEYRMLCWVFGTLSSPGVATMAL